LEIMDRLERLEKMPWSSNSGPAKGPKRLAKFCLLAILLPIACLCIPLYMRFQALKPHFFMLTPNDMKLLNHESRISTVWCEGQELRMNGSFNAYLLRERPKLRRFRQHVTMKRKMMLEDDVKEFWGFYLLRGSRVRLATCSRHEGASFILVKGLKDARRCSYLGELDSAEESDEISDEFEFSHDITATDDVTRGVVKDVTAITNNDTLLFGTNGTKASSSNGRTIFRPSNTSSEAMAHFMHKFKAMSANSKQVFVKKLLKSLGQDPNSEEHLTDAQATSKFFAFKVQDKPDLAAELKTKKKAVINDLAVEDDLEADSGGEVFDDNESNHIRHEDKGQHADVYDLIDRGRFDQTNPNDKSKEETRSSWSSSEEALARCEGLIYNVPLNGNRNCSEANPDVPEHSMARVDFEVPSTGFYYFIFANENEITANFIRAHFDMHKTVFDVSPQVNNCTNTSSCVLPLKFWSEDHVVLEIPADNAADKSDGDQLADPCYQESLIKGYSSHTECNRVIVAESVCKPRKPLFMAFILLVPVMILVFAYI